MEVRKVGLFFIIWSILIFGGNLSFLKRVGKDLYLDDRPFRMVGVNKHDLFINFLKNEKEQSIKSIEAAAKQGIKVIRFCGSGFWPIDMKYWARDEIYWKAFDELVETAKKNGVFLIPTINWNIHLFPDMAKESLQDMLNNPDSRSRQYLWLYTYQIVNRYKNEPTILFWELTNEWNNLADLAFQTPYGSGKNCWIDLGTHFMRVRRDHFTTDELIVFVKEWASFIKSIDKNHLIGSGFSIPRPAAQHLRLAKGKGDWTRDSVEEFATYLGDVHPDPIDLISIHFYPGEATLRFGNEDVHSATVLEIIKKTCDNIGKPFYIGETGVNREKYPDSPFLKNVFEKVIELKIPLTLVWQWMVPKQKEFCISVEDTPQIVELIKATNEKLKAISK